MEPAVKRFAWFSMIFLCLGVSLYAGLVYGLLPLGKYLHPDMRANFVAHPVGIYLHVFAAMFALALGPFQFSAKLRARRPRLHRFMGRLYLGVGVSVGGVSGLYMAGLAFGGVAAKTGFALLALAWLYTGWRAFAAIRGGDVATHRAWMIRNFSLTLAAVTLRIYLPFPMAMGIPFEASYPVIAWLCWVPNLALAQLWLYRSAKRATTRHTPASAAPAQNVAAGPT
jgi:uncharacterized membrane protein